MIFSFPIPGDLENWKDERGDKSQPMKASTFASEDPAPYTPITISGESQENYIPPLQKINVCFFDKISNFCKFCLVYCDLVLKGADAITI